MKKILAFLLLGVILISGCSPTTAAPDISADLQARLDLLVEKLEKQRQTSHVPGMALAVVKDDEVILTHGFGLADMSANTPVEDDTVFAIGSCTKAFTSALVGMLVDEGKMDWDAPVTDYLPYFDMDIMLGNEGDVITVRDALSHRTGHTRMGLLFASGEIPLEEVLHDAVKAEPFVPFRQSFHYSNVMYMSAGVAAGKVEDTDWDMLVEERIFEPLGMDSTTTSITKIEEDSDLASGYLWDSDLQEYVYRPMRNVDNIGPAGSINSNIIDMAEWLRMLLNDGEYEGKQLISEKNLEETWKKEINISGSVGYGMGWMIRDWEGQRVIEHGGNVDGFSAQVALLPEDDLGFVLLTNATASSLPPQVINTVWDTLLGELSDSGSGVSYEPYTGKYIANFGSFKDEVFTVLVQNGRLALDIPGQQTYELKNPDAEDKWYFAISSDVAISFERDEGGNVVVMKMHQAGMTFEIPREGVEVTAEIPLDELQKYLGSYKSDELGMTVEVLIQSNRLALDIPGQMVYELYPPDDEGKWAFRVNPDIKVGFSESSPGAVDSMTMYQAGMEFLMPRTESKKLPTVDEIMELRDAAGAMAELEAMGDYRVDATVYSAQSGVRGTVSIWVSGPDKYRVDADYGKYGKSCTVVNGDRAWVESDFGPFRELHGKFLRQAQMGHPYVMSGDWRDYYDIVKVVGTNVIGSTEVYVVELKSGDMPKTTVYVDTVTGDVLITESVSIAEGDVYIPVITRNEDFREVDGVRSAARAISSNDQSGRTIVEEYMYETNLELDDSFFVLTPPED